MSEELCDLSLVPEHLRRTVNILLSHENYLSDGYWYYVPGDILDDDPEAFGGDKVLAKLTAIAKEIAGES